MNLKRARRRMRSTGLIVFSALVGAGGAPTVAAASPPSAPATAPTVPPTSGANGSARYHADGGTRGDARHDASAHVHRLGLALGFLWKQRRLRYRAGVLRGNPMTETGLFVKVSVRGCSAQRPSGRCVHLMFSGWRRKDKSVAARYTACNPPTSTSLRPQGCRTKGRLSAQRSPRLSAKAICSDVERAPRPSMGMHHGAQMRVGQGRPVRSEVQRASPSIWVAACEACWTTVVEAKPHESERQGCNRLEELGEHLNRRQPAPALVSGGL